MNGSKSKLNKKSKQPFNINRKSLLGLLSMTIQEFIEKLLTTSKLKKSKEYQVLDLVRRKAIKNNPDSILRLIDNFAYKNTFLMNIGDKKGLLLEEAIKDSGASNVLELGVYLGYSSIRILKTLSTDGKLTSIEANDEFADIANEHIEKAGLSSKHEIKVGRSDELIPTLNEQFDFVFIDHWKDLYLSDLKLLESSKLLKKGAWIFADNVILFNLEDYLGYVRSSDNFDSKFVPALREYSSSHPDGVEISIYRP